MASQPTNCLLSVRTVKDKSIRQRQCPPRRHIRPHGVIHHNANTNDNERAYFWRSNSTSYSRRVYSAAQRKIINWMHLLLLFLSPASYVFFCRSECVHNLRLVCYISMMCGRRYIDERGAHVLLTMRCLCQNNRYIIYIYIIYTI